ncbi:MAG TPA: hypothetical protein VK507_03825 [Iamia sp.]|nr:hypothetical protein [Iamia sp.]
MTDPDPLLAALAALDPTVADPPPAPGSTRVRQILERAMTAAAVPSTPTADVDDVASLDGPRPPRRRLLLAAAAAAVVVAGLGVLVVAQPDRRPDPVAALTAAAEATGDVDSLRVRGTYTQDGETRTLEGEANGSDSHITIISPDGSIEERTVIGDVGWNDEDGGPFPVTVEMVNAPYPEASRAVVRAALQGAVVEDLGADEAGGVDADHYAIELGEAGVAALDALAPRLVAQFELENPGAVTNLEVWVADDLIRRIDVETTVDDGGASPQVLRMSLEYLDIGAETTIEPPR